MNPKEPIWRGFHHGYQLPENEVHVWRTTLDVAAPGVAKLQSILSPNERKKADLFCFERDRRRSVIGRSCLRLLLGQILRLPAGLLQFECDKFGKPSLSQEHRSLQFNLSHSGDLVLVAIARDRAVGIDVERIRTDMDVDDIAARFFSANERRIVASVDGLARYEAFFSCWTRKEAYLKAKGVGLATLDEEEPELLANQTRLTEGDWWKLRSLDVPHGYAAALVAAIIFVIVMLGLGLMLLYW